MKRQPIVTQTIPVSQARQRFGELVNQVFRRHVRVIVEKSGIPVAALVSLPDLERCLDQEQISDFPGPRPDAAKKERPSSEPPSKEELARRQALADKILHLREQSDISPLTTTDLVRQARKARGKDYERWTH